MNIIDYAIIAIFALFILAGFYRGFLATVFNIGGYFVSWIVSLLVRIPIALAIKSNVQLYNMMLYYTEGSEYIKNLEYVRVNIDAVSSPMLNSLIADAQLPYPMGRAITANIANEAFAAENVTTLGDYFNQTIVCVFINIIAFLISFAVIRLIIGFILNGVDYAWSFPVLRRGDNVLGASLGIVRGILALFLIFMLLPIVLTAFGNIALVTDLVEGSFFAGFFYRSNFLLAMIPGVI